MVTLNPVLDFLSGIVAPRQNPTSTRPKKVLIYSSDGYTESSVLALSLLMKEMALDLPGAYLELQVSFSGFYLEFVDFFREWTGGVAVFTRYPFIPSALLDWKDNVRF